MKGLSGFYLLITSGLLLCLSLSAYALRLPLPALGDDLSGTVQFVEVKAGDHFNEIARHFELGYYELVEANPSVNPENLIPGTLLILPTQFILPPVVRKGIVINLAEMRLYYFPQGKNYFYTFPVGIGKENWETPLGLLYVIQKIKNPIWHVPDSVYRYRQQQGDPVPHDVGVGPDNPLGQYALRLSKPTYLIHGTNDPASVGRRSSAGCIHLYPENIAELFKMIPYNTPVTIINQPYLLGWHGNQLYIEAHLPLQEERAALANYARDVAALASIKLGNQMGVALDTHKVITALKTHTGLPEIAGQLFPHG